MAFVRGTIGAPDTETATRLLWRNLTLAIPADLVSGGGTTVQLDLFDVQTSSFRSLRRVSYSVRTKLAGETGSVVGPDLTDAWEGFDPAIILEAGGHRLPIPGPSNAASDIADTAEPYDWRPPNRTSPPYTEYDAANNFITNYGALTADQKAQTQITLADEVVGARATLRAGTPRIEAWPDQWNPVTLRAGTPRVRTWPDQWNPVALRAGRPRIAAWPNQWNPVLLRAGTPAIKAELSQWAPVTLRAGTPRIEPNPAYPLAASLRAGAPRIEAHPAYPLAATLRAGTPRIAAWPNQWRAMTLRAGNPYIFVWHEEIGIPAELAGILVTNDGTGPVMEFARLNLPPSIVSYEYRIDGGDWIRVQEE